jgi:hypothetical protein
MITPQDDIEKRGRKHGHTFGAWLAVDLDFEYLPPLPQFSKIEYRAPRMRIECTACGAWAALLSPDGIHCNSNAFDAQCAGPTRR